MTVKYRIESFEATHANRLLNSGEVEDFKIDYNTKTLECQDSWTGFYHNEPIACGGIIELWSGVADIWLIVSKHNDKHKFFIMRNIKKILEQTIKQRKYVRVQATVREDFDVGIKFAQWFGMKSEGLMEKYGLDGKNYYRYVRIT